MARIGDVWDSTVDAARGRAKVIAPVALLAFFLPGLLQNAIVAYADPQAGGTVGLMGLVTIATLVVAVWGQLTIIAIATDPATTRPDASAQGARRFLPALGIGVLMALIVLVASLPFFIALAASGIDFRALSQMAPGTQPDLSGAATGPVVFAFLYLLVFLGFMLWLAGRLMLAYAVVLNERRGAGALRRSLQLTAGMTGKLIGVLVLYVVVLGIVAFAVQSVVFFLFRIPLGEEGIATATFLGAVAGGLVTSALAALFCVFTARLYVATAGVPARHPAGDVPRGA